MIRISAIGGLGNQLFIWNLAHLLELNYKKKVIIYYPKSGSNRICEIAKIVDYCTHRIEIKESNRLVVTFGILNRLSRNFPRLGKMIISLLRAQQTNYPADTFQYAKDSPRFVNGYFQSVDLVVEGWENIKNELFQVTRNYYENSILKDFDLSTKKAIHIRRGDFKENKCTAGLLAMEYFNTQIIEGECPIILTDAESEDLQLRKYFPKVQIFGDGSMDTWTSFSILTYAGILITSNSTFSWWAGVVNKSRGGNVFVPNPWTKTNVYGDNYLYFDKFNQIAAIFESCDQVEQNTWK